MSDYYCTPEQIVDAYYSGELGYRYPMLDEAITSLILQARGARTPRNGPRRLPDAIGRGNPVSGSTFGAEAPGVVTEAQQREIQDLLNKVT